MQADDLRLVPYRHPGYLDIVGLGLYLEVVGPPPTARVGCVEIEAWIAFGPVRIYRRAATYEAAAELLRLFVLQLLTSGPVVAMREVARVAREGAGREYEARQHPDDASRWDQLDGAADVLEGLTSLVAASLVVVMTSHEPVAPEPLPRVLGK